MVTHHRLFSNISIPICITSIITLLILVDHKQHGAADQARMPSRRGPNWDRFDLNDPGPSSTTEGCLRNESMYTVSWKHKFATININASDYATTISTSTPIECASYARRAASARCSHDMSGSGRRCQRTGTMSTKWTAS